MTIIELEKSADTLKSGKKLKVSNGIDKFIIKKEGKKYIVINKDKASTAKSYINLFDLFEEIDLFNDKALLL